MLRAVQNTIEQRGLLADGGHVLVAVSGGADSVALTYALHYLRRRYGFTLTLAHLNHRIRGRAADADARFVYDLAWRLGIPCIQAGIDVPARARRGGVSLEMAAREARYDFLLRVARDVKATRLATAHTADDQVETVILRLARGAGPQGLSGIPYRAVVDGVEVIRPMRDVTHAAAVLFLRGHGLTWREDESNRDLQHLRNRVRHEVIPLLEKRLNPRVRGAILRAGDVLREESEWMDRQARKRIERCREKSRGNGLSVEGLLRQPPALRRRIFRLWLAACGIDLDQVDFDAMERMEKLIQSSRGMRMTPLTGSFLVTRRYDVLTVHAAKQRPAQNYRQPIAVPGETVVPAAALRVVAKVDAGILRQTGMRAGDLPAEASFDIRAIGSSPVIIRRNRRGDRIRPLGLAGSRKLQDIFVDQKIPRDLRSFVPVLECRGEVIWIPGYRVARGWEVKDASGPSLHVFLRPL